MKYRYKVLINWSGEVLVFYTHATSEKQALHQAIRQCAARVGYQTSFVNKYVKDENARRWEIVK